MEVLLLVGSSETDVVRVNMSLATKQDRCPSTEEWIRKMWYIYTMEYYAAEKNNDIMKFAGKWMELENVILSERIPSFLVALNAFCVMIICKGTPHVQTPHMYVRFMYITACLAYILKERHLLGHIAIAEADGTDQSHSEHKLYSVYFSAVIITEVCSVNPFT
ncbi:hypothetical protein STEG23_001212 [Scotinomys teguina]